MLAVRRAHPALLLVVVAACGGGPRPSHDPTPVATDPSMASNPGAAADTTPGSPEPVATTPTPEQPGTMPPPATDPALALAASEAEAFSKAKPVFEKFCAKCHQAGGKKAKPKTLAHFAIEASGVGGHEPATLTKELRQVLGIGGGAPTMPLDAPGAVKGDDLAAIAAWADAHDAAHAK